VKPLDGVQRVQVPYGQSKHAGRERVIPFTGRLVSAKPRQQRSRPRRFSSENRLIAMPMLLTRRKAASRRPILRGRAGVARVTSSGHFSKGIPQEPRRARYLCSQ